MQPCTLPVGCHVHAKVELGTHFLSGGLELGDGCPTEGQIYTPPAPAPSLVTWVMHLPTGELEGELQPDYGKEDH